MKDEKSGFIFAPSNGAVTRAMRSLIKKGDLSEAYIRNEYAFSDLELERFILEIRQGKHRYNPPKDVKHWMDSNFPWDEIKGAQTRPRFPYEDVDPSSEY